MQKIDERRNERERIKTEKKRESSQTNLERFKIMRKQGI